MELSEYVLIDQFGVVDLVSLEIKVYFGRFMDLIEWLENLPMLVITIYSPSAFLEYCLLYLILDHHRVNKDKASLLKMG